MKKNRNHRIIRHKDTILRILDTEENKVLAIDCVKRGMPKWISLSGLKDGVEISKEDFGKEMQREIPEEISASARKTMHERFTIISGILPYVGDKRKRSQRIADAAEKYKVSQNTVKNYLGLYLAYQDISVLAPKEKKKKRELTQDEKNMRWALNKFYYTKEKQSLSTVYTLMLKEKYCDRNGKLPEHYPSMHQLRYFYEKTKKMQTYYISRDGLKDYQRNHRPLLGDGVQEFCSVGVGMLDGTVCDIYLVDDAGHLVGRPILLACVDAYTSFCYGYSLLWEGGVYSLRNLMLNVIADKKEWCRKFGILIDKEQWDCDRLPGLMLTDMGTEYTSENFGQITELGVTIQNLPAYRPELKGQVEKFFDLIQSEYKKHLKGKGVIEPDYRERGAHDYRKDACLTMRDFETVILRCILYYNSQRIIENFPYTEEMLQEEVKPFASSIFEWGKQKEGVNLIPVSKEELILTLLPRTTGKLTRFGLRVKGMRYHADGYTEKYLKGGEVTVAYNPEDVSHVWLFENGNYQIFDLIESRFRGKDMVEAEKLKADCNEMIKNASAGNLQAKIDLAMHIQNIASHAVHTEDTKIKNIRRTRQREQRKRHVDFVKEGIGNE
jgi:putative transposase